MPTNSDFAKPAGIVLIILGLVLLAGRSAGFDLSFASISWPLYIIIPGALLLFISSYDKTVGKFLAMFGMAVTLTGCLLAYQEWANHYQSWAYAWILVGPFAYGAGLVLHGLMHNDDSSISIGRKLAAVSLACFVGAAAIFELVFNISGLGSSIDLPWGILLPVALIVAGGAVFLRKSK